MSTYVAITTALGGMGPPRLCCAIAPLSNPTGVGLSLWSMLAHLHSLFIRTPDLLAAADHLQQYDNYWQRRTGPEGPTLQRTFD
jgi:hypothetical protein